MRRMRKAQTGIITFYRKDVGTECEPIIVAVAGRTGQRPEGDGASEVELSRKI